MAILDQLCPKDEAHIEKDVHVLYVCKVLLSMLQKTKKGTVTNFFYNIFKYKENNTGKESIKIILPLFLLYVTACLLQFDVETFQ